jgi:hypothetical protein
MHSALAATPPPTPCHLHCAISKAVPASRGQRPLALPPAPPSPYYPFPHPVCPAGSAGHAEWHPQAGFTSPLNPSQFLHNYLQPVLCSLVPCHQTSSSSSIFFFFFFLLGEEGWGGVGRMRQSSHIVAQAGLELISLLSTPHAYRLPSLPHCTAAASSLFLSPGPLNILLLPLQTCRALSGATCCPREPSALLPVPQLLLPPKSALLTPPNQHIFLPSPDYSL